VVSKGEIDAAYALKLWLGTYDNTPSVTVLPAPDGRVEGSTPAGLMDVLSMQHGDDAEADLMSPISLGQAPSGWVRGQPIAIEKTGSGKALNAVQIDYAPPDGAGRVRVIATGYEWDYLRGRWITRTAQQYFSVTKVMSHAIVSPSRVMLGRNVVVNGPLGVRYASAALDTLDGPPVVSLSDFQGISSTLSAKLARLYTAILADDQDGDNRLRIHHPTESRSLGAMNAQDFNADSQADNAFQDYTRDDAVDDFDVFLKHYDTVQSDGQRKVVLSNALKAGTVNAGNAAEFTADDALGLLIDSGNPDRNGNGKWNGRFTAGAWDYSTFPDNNGDGVLDADDLDLDDVALGYRDGALDYKDRYAKVHGSVYLKASRSAWESSHDDYGVALGDYQSLVKGPIVPEGSDSPVKFNASDAEVPAITAESFAAAAAIMGSFPSSAGVSSDDFAAKISAQVGAEWAVESTPFGSPTPADWYRRPVYRNLTFRNTTIPQGTNALFVNCTFVGVTRIRTWVNNTHPSWVYYGEEVRNPTTGALSLKYPPPPGVSPQALDTSYCGGDVICNPANMPPNPLMVDLNGDGAANEACTNTKLVSNNIRFHDCTFIGSIVADKPVVFSHIRNKLQFTGATKFLEEHPTEPNNPLYALTDAEKAMAAKSSLMVPHYSVDIGTNNSSSAQDIRLQGAVIAGVLDVRGNTEITGALLLTFQPVYGEAPMSVYGAAAGNPEHFNVTLGYFGPADGDQEGIDLASLTDLDADGNLDIGWDSARNSSGALVAVGTSPVQESWFDGVPDTDAVAGTHIRRAIRFNGFGRITLNLDRTLVLPDGLATPISIVPVRSTYLEGAVAAAEGD
ncbi:MAG: hypothetical protein JNK58_11570, partial [Phycisphaerae bacterium]|nr:hypothetical protein [Phycisphaerae bacterium]